MPSSAIIPAHYHTVAQAFSDLQSHISPETRAERGSGPCRPLNQPLVALATWQKQFTVTYHRLAGQFRRLSSSVLVRSSSPSPATVQKRLIAIQQSLTLLVNLESALERHYFPGPYVRGQQLLLAAIQRILVIINDIFSFYAQALCSPRNATMIWQQPIECRVEVTALRQWLQDQQRSASTGGYLSEFVGQCRDLLLRTRLNLVTS